MKKQLILLASSKKYGKYCVAGVDVSNGTMIRLISASSNAHFAVDPAQMTFSDGTMAQKLDLVEVECTDRSVSYFQSENWVLRQNSPWIKLRAASLDEVLRLHPPNQCEHVFYDRSRKLHRDRFMELNPRQIRSLLLIHPESCELLIQQSWERRQALFAFSY
ncbi:MAG: hypothetical protein U1B83_07950, partial [Candidatus Cloacimonadaceae bacterium]|nr:hypothetical protein [Candidatus Cloacimonadaceae bacterium]